MKTWSHERLGLSGDEAGKPSWSREGQVKKLEFYSVYHGELSANIIYIRYLQWWVLAVKE